MTVIEVWSLCWIAEPLCQTEMSVLLPQVHLRLILVSGKTQDFTFSPNDSATDIAKHVFENWPAGKCLFTFISGSSYRLFLMEK